MRLFEFVEKETPPSRQPLAEGNGFAALTRLHAIDRRVRNGEGQDH